MADSVRRKIGFFGGSFDPIHFGHIHLALSLQEAHHLDEVWFCPAFVSPHKTLAPPQASAEHRLEMTRLALLPFESFRLLEDEVRRQGPSYTIDTVKALLSSPLFQEKSSELFLLLADDALATLSTWKEIDELLLLARPLLGTRKHIQQQPSLSLLSSDSFQRVEQGRTEIPLLDISSTYLRDRLHRKLYCGHLIPQKVLDYIHQNRIYEKFESA